MREPVNGPDEEVGGVQIDVVVPGLLQGVRTDRAVAMLTGCSRSVAAEVLARGGVRVDGRPVVAGATRLAEGQQLSIGGLEGAGSPPPDPEPDVPVSEVHADDDLVVVDKAPGLVVHPGAGHPSGTLVNGLLARYPDIGLLGRSGVCPPERPGIVHRLDRQTSGLLVVARSVEAYHSLAAQLAARTVERRYVALVHGLVAADEGIIDAPIGRASGDPTLMTVVAGGKEARTRYLVERRMEAAGGATLLTLRLETGRTHQIRVHLAAIGHPVVGDHRYGAPSGPVPIGGDRFFLHAATLGFRHPVGGTNMRWESAPPADLRQVLDSWPEP